MERPSGTRAMTTFRKDPMSSPKSAQMGTTGGTVVLCRPWRTARRGGTTVVAARMWTGSIGIVQQ